MHYHKEMSKLTLKMNLLKSITFKTLINVVQTNTKIYSTMNAFHKLLEVQVMPCTKSLTSISSCTAQVLTRARLSIQPSQCHTAPSLPGTAAPLSGTPGLSSLGSNTLMWCPCCQATCPWGCPSLTLPLARQ